MDTVGVFEAKAHLSMLLERVAQGEKITISKRGVPVAVLSPVKADDSAQKRKEVFEKIKKFRQKLNKAGRGLSYEEIVECIKEGRKY